MQNELTFGERIRELRELKKISLRQLAKEVGITAGYLSQLERNHTLAGLPAENNIKKIAAILEIDFIELMLLAGKLPAEVTDNVKKLFRPDATDEDFKDFKEYALNRKTK